MYRGRCREACVVREPKNWMEDWLSLHITAEHLSLLGTAPPPVFVGLLVLSRCQHQPPLRDKPIDLAPCTPSGGLNWGLDQRGNQAEGEKRRRDGQHYAAPDRRSSRHYYSACFNTQMERHKWGSRDILVVLLHSGMSTCASEQYYLVVRSSTVLAVLRECSAFRAHGRALPRNGPSNAPGHRKPTRSTRRRRQ